MDPYAVNMKSGTSLAIRISLLLASMVVHLYDLHYEFPSHRCGPYLYRQLWSVPKVAPWSSLLMLWSSKHISIRFIQIEIIYRESSKDI